MRPFVALLVSLCLAAPLFASCGSASCPLDTNALNAPAVRGFALDLSLQYIRQDRLRGSSAVAPDHDELRTLNRAMTATLTYAASRRLQLAMAVPFVSRGHDHLADGAAESWNLSGVGDVMLHARWAAFEGNPVTKTRLWLGGGMKLPTGRDDIRNRDGEIAELPLQPGTGSTDAMVSVTYESGVLHGKGPVSLMPYFVSGSWRRNGSGREGYRVGDELQLNAGTALPLTHSLELLLQANARRRSRDVVPEDATESLFTGGTVVFASPGLRYSRGAGALYGVVQIPVVQRVNAIQLTSRANLVLGVQARF